MNSSSDARVYVSKIECGVRLHVDLQKNPKLELYCISIYLLIDELKSMRDLHFGEFMVIFCDPRIHRWMPGIEVARRRAGETRKKAKRKSI